MDTEQQASDAIPMLESDLDNLVQFTTEFQHLSYQSGDHYGFILVVFYKRMLEHYKSLCLLKGNRDILLVARSILEGGVLLRWIGDGTDKSVKNKRAIKYQDLFFIEITKHLDRYKQLKNDGSNPFYHIIKLSYNDNELIRPKEFNDIMLGDTLDNESFIKRLTGFGSLYKLYSSFRDDKGYVNYAYMSEYLHWNPLRMGMYVKDSFIGLKEINSLETVTALAIAYFVFSSNTDELSRHFQLGKEERLQEMYNDFIPKLAGLIN
jgi:hypothetical protein